MKPVAAEVPSSLIRCAFFDSGDDGVIVELAEFSGSSDLSHGDVVVAVEVDEAHERFRAGGVRAFDEPPTDNLPLRRGWVLKKDGHGTVIELCLPGQVARFVREALSA